MSAKFTCIIITFKIENQSYVVHSRVLFNFKFKTSRTTIGFLTIYFYKLWYGSTNRKNRGMLLYEGINKKVCDNES